jgi:hypothetical protein
MSVEEITTSVTTVVITALSALAEFIPRLIGGLVVLIIGLVIAAIVDRLVIAVLKTIRFENFLKRYGLSEVEGKEVSWSQVLAELARWAVIIVFLIPTLQVWGMGGATGILNQILLYIPNVVIAVIIALLGLVFARLAYDTAYSATKSLGKDVAHTSALIARWAIIVFVALVVLNQLGVAADLIKILFTGLVAFLALAGGLAFGLGGSDSAKEILNSIKERFKK